MLNRAFRPGGFRFTLQKLAYHGQPTWYTDSSINRIDRRESLQIMSHMGDYKTLNLLFIKDIFRDKGVVGETYLPNWKITDDAWFYMDGPVMTSTCAPEFKNGKWESGVAAIHEVGHWLGLHHPDKEECAQRKMEYCALGSPTASGTDAGEEWANYMFPFETSKKQSFTTGQFDEMRRNWRDFRLQDVEIRNQMLNHLMKRLPMHR
ncbi:hypothetical protein CP533_0291 [Ophiocordyceps camponoti-saundersi (nom. inval.)]|nr:hypothetical protein CP533_0291 [Ophiocordyceps camponoti-saundersi (nom. inval.)]